MREFVVEALRDEAYDVIHARDGEESLPSATSRKGRQVAERRQHHPELPVNYGTGLYRLTATTI
jgi:DNA-binding response OmpR family regulator